MLKETFLIFNSDNEKFLGYMISRSFSGDEFAQTIPVWVEDFTTMFGMHQDIEFVQIADLQQDAAISDRCAVASELYTLLGTIALGMYVFAVPAQIRYGDRNNILNYRIDEMEIDFLRMEPFNDFCGIGFDIELFPSSWENTPYIGARPIK